MKARLIGLLCVILLLTSGERATSQGAALLTISPTKLIFPATPVGSQAAPETVTVTNPSNSNIMVEEIIVSGIDFAQTNNCGNEVAAGAQCSIQVEFKPAIAGERTGNLEIVAADNNVPHFVALTGTGE